jgi:hypothetical protein
MQESILIGGKKIKKNLFPPIKVEQTTRANKDQNEGN